MYQIGIDEAGLGPVFGPLIIAGALVKTKDIFFLKENGVKDSKLFGSDEKAREKRKEVWNNCTPFIKNYKYILISANEIDNNFLIGKSMYDLEINAIAEILNAFEEKSIKNVFIDQLGQLSNKKFLEKLYTNNDFLSEKFNAKIIYEKNADYKYIPVGIASIIAKTMRDSIVERICNDIGEKYISGYPNYKTADFLNKYYQKYNDLPQDVRKTRNWEPLCKLIEK